MRAKCYVFKNKGVTGGKEGVEEFLVLNWGKDEWGNGADGRRRIVQLLLI